VYSLVLGPASRFIGGRAFVQEILDLVFATQSTARAILNVAHTGGFAPSNFSIIGSDTPQEGSSRILIFPPRLYGLHRANKPFTSASVSAVDCGVESITVLECA